MLVWLIDSFFFGCLVFWWFGWFLVGGGFVVSGGTLQREQTCPCSLCPSSGSSRIKQQKWDTASQGGQVGSRIDHWCWWSCFGRQTHSQRSPKKSATLTPKHRTGEKKRTNCHLNGLLLQSIIPSAPVLTSYYVLIDVDSKTVYV